MNYLLESFSQIPVFVTRNVSESPDMRAARKGGCRAGGEGVCSKIYVFGLSLSNARSWAFIYFRVCNIMRRRSAVRAGIIAGVWKSD